MSVSIRLMFDEDMEPIVQLSLLAWAPVFDSFQQVLGERIYALMYPNWKRQQQEVVEKYCRDEQTIVYVANVDGRVAGFITYTINDEDKTGEVDLLAVHPEYQNRGIGTELNTFVFERMKERGIKLAVVGTGGDPGHAPARRSYEKAGYIGLPLMRYYKDL
ncbi:GNAT family N-acetyltransferase [Dictyobacter kobayashii]|uniref:GNAT family N-acetyltransferase n=1 Tax=Dictyobacter kobayashii TaxID=2014872 RepID=A0A402AK09_9CHLR|nr:GNAT family N-acetyltransferase [Dictyobacter kobayashii]GCE19442.1 GNAT family N-acetyltransferase [Dictyobacter kobayashii]